MNFTNSQVGQPLWARKTFVVVLLLAVVATVFSQALRSGFVFWDDAIVYENPQIRGLSWRSIVWMFTDTKSLWRYMPLTWLGWEITYELFGLNPLGFHLGNLLLHGANTVLVFLILDRVFRTALGKDFDRNNSARFLWCAAAGTLFWAIHPLRVEPVVWITDRVYDQALFLLLISLLCYLRAYSPGSAPDRRFYWFSVLGFAASLLSYQTGLGFVMVLLILDIYPLRRTTLRSGWWRQRIPWRLVLEKVPFAVVSALVVFVTLVARFDAASRYPKPVSLADFGLLDRVMQAFYIWAYFAWKPLLPLDLSPFYTTLLSFDPLSWPFVLSTVFVIIVTALLVIRARRWPLLATLWLCHLILLVPVLGLTEHPHYPSDRYGLIANLTWAVLVTAVLWRFTRSARLRLPFMATAGVVVLAFAAGSYRLSAIWCDSVALHEHIIAKLGNHPSRLSFYVRLGHIYLSERGDQTNAMRWLDRALVEDPNLVQARIHLADILHRRRHFAKAIEHYQVAIRLLPNESSLHQNLGAVLADDGQVAEALAAFRKSVELDPANLDARRNLVRALTDLGQTFEAQKEREEIQRREASRANASAH